MEQNHKIFDLFIFYSALKDFIIWLDSHHNPYLPHAEHENCQPNGYAVKSTDSYIIYLQTILCVKFHILLFIRWFTIARKYWCYR